MNIGSTKNYSYRFVVIIAIIALYLGPWHLIRYSFAKEWYMPKIVNLQTVHFEELTVGGFGSGVGFDVRSHESGKTYIYRYKVAGGWFLLLPLVAGIVVGMDTVYGVRLFVFHILASLVNAFLFYIGAAYSDFLLAAVDLSCYYLVPALSLALIPFLIISKQLTINSEQ